MKAVKKAHVEIVKILLLDSRVNPSDDDNYDIKYAIWNRHTEIVNLLILSDSRFAIS